jgi:hypothetical protein
MARMSVEQPEKLSMPKLVKNGQEPLNQCESLEGDRCLPEIVSVISLRLL